MKYILDTHALIWDYFWNHKKMKFSGELQIQLSTYAELFTHSDPYCEKFLQISMCN